jgi:hypothetical protein
VSPPGTSMTPAAVLAAGGGLYWLCKFNLKFKFIKFGRQRPGLPVSHGAARASVRHCD